MNKPMTVTPQDLEYANAEGLNKTELAREVGCTRSSVMRAEEKFGVSILTPRNAPNDYRKCVKDMKANEAVEYLLDCIDVLLSVDAPPENQELITSLGLTGQQGRIFLSLAQSVGKIVTKNAIYDAMFFDRPVGDWPDLKIVDVQICKLRQKLPPKYRIETIWGVGYRLHEVEPDDAT